MIPLMLSNPSNFEVRRLMDYNKQCVNAISACGRKILDATADITYGQKKHNQRNN